ncbi:MAG: hypothetical protein V4501_08205 [Pseudomonadota bacterium]
MSSDRTILWVALQHNKIPNTKHFQLLIAMAQNADDEVNPQAKIAASIKSLCEFTRVKYKDKDRKQDRKTVIAGLQWLKNNGFIEDTNEREGATRRIVVYRLKVPADFKCVREAAYSVAENTLENRWQMLDKTYPKQEPQHYDYKNGTANGDIEKELLKTDHSRAKYIFEGINPTDDQVMHMIGDITSRRKAGGEWYGWPINKLPRFYTYLTEWEEKHTEVKPKQKNKKFRKAKMKGTHNLKQVLLY